MQAVGLALGVATAATLLSLSAPSPLVAQEPADSALPLDSIVVDALRLPTYLATAPFAVTVLGVDDTRRARSGRGLAEALHGVPGLQVSDRSNDALGERIVLRGAGARAGFGVRGVRVLIDGIPATLADGQTDLSRLDVARIGRVEVLRGPASALYGNASGGVIRISSERPPAGAAFAPGLEALRGANGLLRLHARAGGRAGAGWYDAAASHREIDGFRAHSASTRSSLAASGGLALAGGELGVQASANAYDARNPGSLAAATLRADRTQAHPANVTQRAGEEAEQLLAGATWTGPAGPGLLEVMAWGTARTLDNPIPVAIIDLERRAGGARAVYGFDALVVGAELDAQRDDRRNFENEGGARGDRTLDQLERVRALGLFAHGRVPLGSRLAASAGLRYDRFRFAVDDRLVSTENPDDSGERSMDALSPSVALHARVSEAVSMFANVATAFETPTTTELANRPDGAGGFNPGLEPQRTLSLELGARDARGPLRWEVALWRARVEDALVVFDVPGFDGRQFFRNAASAEQRGAEAAVALEWPRGLEWSVAYAAIDARYDDYVADSVSYDGRRVPGIAPHRIHAGLTRRADRWLVGLEATHNAAVPTDDANSAEAGDWTLLDARGEVQLFDGVSVFGGVHNALDQHYVGSVVVNQAVGRYYEPAPGRGFYFGVRAGAR